MNFSQRNLARIVACAIEAARAIRACAKRNRLVHYKKDSTPLTRADLAAHHKVVEGLRVIDPAIPVISEEGVIPPYSTRKKWRRYWLVDPLDGTKDYLAGRRGYTVNIALIERNRPVLGVIVAPATREVYYAAKGLGAWYRKEAGKPTRLQLRPGSGPARNGKIRVLVSRSHLGAKMDTIQKRYPSVQWLSVGSSIKFAWVANNRADWYLRLTPTMEWDVAAGDCILTEARGSAAGSGKRAPSPLRYNKKSLRNPSFVVGANLRGECFASPAAGAARFERLIKKHLEGTK